ncbi:hypothetical protein BGZ94_006367 [Podila epigama]|nr:hypothetical protein BGZ94_006367 [Podila epigama]
MSLQQELDEDNGMASDGLYYLQTGSPMQVYQSAVSMPVIDNNNSSGSGSNGSTPMMVSTAGFTDGTTTRSSAYETVASSSSNYATADSPTLSAATLQSQDIHVSTLEPSDWRHSGSGRPESSQIRELIRDVLED